MDFPDISGEGAPPQSDAPWSCHVCTLENSAESMQCEVCGAARKGTWTCKACTMLNVVSALACAACGTAPMRRGKSAKKCQWRKGDHLLADPLSSLEQRAVDTSTIRPSAQSSSAQAMIRGQFVQGTCRLIVGTDFASANAFWRNVIKVEMPCEEAPQCPICLDVPEAPRISECGHVFCTRCVLRHLDMSRSCPMCPSILLFENLRPVRFDVLQPMKPTEEHEFVLVRRSGDHFSFAWQRHPDVGELTCEGQEGWKFARKVLGDPHLRKEQLQSDIRVLEQEVRPCVTSALVQLREQITSLNTSETWMEARHDDGADDRSMLFYQSADGQLVFLEPELTKQLLATHGSWSALPHRVWLSPVTELRGESVTAWLQERHRFLDHIAGGEVRFAQGILRDAPGAELEEPAPSQPSHCEGSAEND